MNTLLKHEIVLKVDGWNSWSDPIFTAEGDDTPWHIIELDNDVYNELGRPNTITVTIEPGDRLNEA